MISKLDVKGMNHRVNRNIEFYQNMNVLTGLNGSSKTTLLTLLWCLTSGNLHRVISEIPFTSVNIETDWFNLSVEQTDDEAKIKSEFTGEPQKSKNVTLNSENLADDLGELNEQIANVVPGSLFFPTFRRLEGGNIYTAEPAYEDLQNAMLGFSDALSFKDPSGEDRHKFIAAVSTEDVGELLMQKHKQLEDLKNELDADTSTDKNTLNDRFSLLRDLVKDVYPEYGKINIPRSISFDGKGDLEISSENFSSGEKQLFGFLCHNAFSDDALMFLDEPELSLHVDYQRVILQLLVLQGTPKQFFVATHSPFIYTKYPNSEINLEEKVNEAESS